MANWPYSAPETVQAALRAAVPTTIARAPEGVPVLITGCVAGPGPGGPLTGPFSGAPCVWFRTLFWGALTGLDYFRYSGGTVGPEKYYRPPAQFWTSDFAIPPDSHRAFADERTPHPITVTDGTGSITVDASRTQIQSRTLTSNRVDDGSDGRPAGTLIEWIVGPGQPVELLGAVRREPDGRAVLVPDQGNVAVLSTLTGRFAAMREYATTGRVPEELIRTRTDRLLAQPGGVQKLILRSGLIAAAAGLVFVVLLVLAAAYL